MSEQRRKLGRDIMHARAQHPRIRLIDLDAIRRKSAGGTIDRSIEPERHQAVPADRLVDELRQCPGGDDAAATGFPLLVKAAAGGGGRGMRVVREPDGLADAMASAAREAESAFGDPSLYLELYLEGSRHVEVQALGDGQGGAVHLGLRYCSLQRRHQKLVEEAPAPFLSADQMERLYSASKAILAEAGYVGAGTCEFLVGTDGTISFLEVNTRLQVEHPVTEEVTGIDLVREQFRIANGEPLGYSDPAPRAHSIEFRINGEDAGRNFLPAPGTVSVFQPPSGPGVRLDSGIVEGDTIAGAFDSMLSKLIVTGHDRKQALQRARRALDRRRRRGARDRRRHRSRPGPGSGRAGARS